MAQRTTAVGQPASLDQETLARLREALLRLEQDELARLGEGAVDDARRELLDAVREALARVDAGTYGRCVACGNLIEPARLDALPYAPRCLSCQRRLERA